MDNLKDYIPLFIIAASFVFSIVKGAAKKSKKEETANLPQEEETVQEEMKPVFRSFQPPKRHMVSPEPTYDVWTYDEIESQKVKDSHVKVDHNRTVTPSPKHVFSQDKEDDKLFIFEEEPTGTVRLDDLTDPEELQKAVIYAEILQRKYT